ncbi:MAG TPA: hypothetical protein VGL59_17260 [Polyangia bacterium]|jgi:hypothetical protein
MKLVKHLAWGLLMGLILSGCIDDNGRGYYNRGYFPATCRKFANCDSCTMALGCGWCQSGVHGLCTSDPDQCANATTFSWTWEATGCPGAPADGGAADGGTSVEPAADGGTAVDATSDVATDAGVDAPIAADVADEAG